MKKVIQNLKFKIKNRRKQPSFAWVPSLSSMIVVSILGVVSSNFDYYLALTQTQTSFKAYPVPGTGNLTVYRYPDFYQCVENPSVPYQCFFLPNNAELEVQLEKKYWLRIISCKLPTGKELCRGLNYYTSSNFVSCPNPNCIITPENFQRYRNLAQSTVKNLKDNVESFTRGVGW